MNSAIGRGREDDVKELARTNDMVRMSFLRALLTDAGIEHVVLDTHMSITEGSANFIAPRLMGHARAFSLLVMGKPLTAEEAMGAGIVNTVVPAAELDAHALNVARDVAALPPESVTAARRLMRGSVDEIVARIDEEAEAFKARLASPEAQRALTTFLSRKR